MRLDSATIIRAPHDTQRPYFAMSRETAQNRNLSWEARGVLAYLLSKPSDWRVMVSDLRQQCGRDKVYRILKELIDACYLKRVSTHDGKGHFTGYEYMAFETPYATPKQDSPETGNPYPEKPETDLPDTENQETHISESPPKTDLQKSEETKTTSDTITPEGADDVVVFENENQEVKLESAIIAGFKTERQKEYYVRRYGVLRMNTAYAKALEKATDNPIGYMITLLRNNADLTPKVAKSTVDAFADFFVNADQLQTKPADTPTEPDGEAPTASDADNETPAIDAFHPLWALVESGVS